MNENILQVYYWDDVFLDYSAGMAVAIAGSKEEAAKMCAVAVWGDENSPSVPNAYDELMNTPCDVFPVNEPIGFAVWGGG